MKQNKGFRTGHDDNAEDALKKAVKLAPIKKSGKEKHYLYSDLEDEDEDLELNYRERESILDYFDDGEEEDNL